MVRRVRSKEHLVLSWHELRSSGPGCSRGDRIRWRAPRSRRILFAIKKPDGRVPATDIPQILTAKSSVEAGPGARATRGGFQRINSGVRGPSLTTLYLSLCPPTIFASPLAPPHRASLFRKDPRIKQTLPPRECSQSPSMSASAWIISGRISDLASTGSWKWDDATGRTTGRMEKYGSGTRITRREIIRAYIFGRRYMEQSLNLDIKIDAIEIHLSYIKRET